MDQATHSTELDQLIADTVDVPTVPACLGAVQKVTRSEHASTSDLADVVERDPAVATQVLKAINSSLHGLQDAVSSIPIACGLLGFKAVRNIALEVAVVECFQACPEDAPIDPAWLWDHSVKTGVAARLLAAAAPVSVAMDGDEAFVCGLIHDVGKVLLIEQQPDMFAQAVALSLDANVPLAKAEVELFGFSHAEVIGRLVGSWNLAPTIRAAVTYHHGPGTTPEEWVRGFLLQVANTIAHQAATGTGGWVGDECAPDVLAVLGISAQTLDRIRTTVRAARSH